MSEKLMRYWPEYYKTIIDFVYMDETQSVELEQLQKAAQQQFADQFIVTSGLQAVQRREKMLGIQADPAIESLDFRRRRILNRYQTKPPFTVRYLQQLLDRLVGPGMTIASVDVDKFLLTITANIDNASVFKEVLHTIETIKPANLVYQQNTAIEGAIKLEEKISIREFQWNYKLNGTWSLGEEPFVTLGSEVMVK